MKMMKFTLFLTKNVKKSHLFGVFGKICAFFWFILLSGCARTPAASTTIANGAINATVALEKSLPPQCATDAIKAQINTIKTQISAITSACDTEKAAITAEKVRWQWAFFALLIIIAACIGKKIAGALR